MFFYYCFSTRFGYDQVCRDEQRYGDFGDVLEANGSYFIALGDAIAWQDTYMVPGLYFEMRNVQVIAKIFSKQTQQLIHWMVYRYYTSYKSVIHLFVGDIMYYLKAFQRSKTMKGKDRLAYASFNAVKTQNQEEITAQSKLILAHLPMAKQTLIVFPDLLSLRYRIGDLEYILSGQDTMSKVMKYYYDLQHGYKNILITTSANIFMDWKCLSQIICYFPQTRYYKSQQNPRYYVPEVLEKLTEIWEAKLIYINE